MGPGWSGLVSTCCRVVWGGLEWLGVVWGGPGSFLRWSGIIWEGLGWSGPVSVCFGVVWGGLGSFLHVVRWSEVASLLHVMARSGVLWDGIGWFGRLGWSGVVWACFCLFLLGWSAVVWGWSGVVWDNMHSFLHVLDLSGKWSQVVWVVLGWSWVAWVRFCAFQGGMG